MRSPRAVRGLAAGVVVLAGCVGGVAPPGAPGALDPTLAGDGTATLAASGPGFADGRAVAIDGEGRVVVAGQVRRAIGVVRFLADGTPDPGFGTGGVAVVPIGEHARALAVAVAPDGSVVAAGFANQRPGVPVADVAVVRLRPDGRPDPGFDGDGVATTAFAGYAAATAVALDPQGRVVVAGSVAADEQDVLSDVLVARFGADGRLDRTFAGDGTATLGRPADTDVAGGVALAPDGGVIVAGTTVRGGPTDGLVARLRADGTPDPTFGTGGDGGTGPGVVVTDLGSPFDALRAVVRQPDGRIVAAGGIVRDGTSAELALVRYEADGRLDAGFGGGGVVTAGAGEGTEGNAVALDAQGRILTAGRARGQLLLARHLPDGRLDLGFGVAGAALTSVGDGPEAGFGVALDASGRAVVAGCTCDGSGSSGRGGIEIPSEVLVARYRTDPGG